eukprot:10518108-Prorocentrum_lima.AAC.1
MRQNVEMQGLPQHCLQDIHQAGLISLHVRRTEDVVPLVHTGHGPSPTCQAPVGPLGRDTLVAVSYTHLRAHETRRHL